MSKIAAVVNFSTNEAAFLAPCLQELALFCSDIVIVVCDHFFDGMPENRPLLDAIYRTFPYTFIEYPFDVQKGFYGLHNAHFWHDLSRLIGFAHLKDQADWLFFLDVDEIVEAKKMMAWLKTVHLEKHVAYKLACYWYFRSLCWQAKQWEATPLLVQSQALTYDNLMQNEERAGTFATLEGVKQPFTLGLDDLPMVHHYSWVRSEAEAMRKASAWGHRNERDWLALIRNHWNKPFEGVDFVHGYQFIKVEPYIKTSHLIKLTGAELMRLDLKIKFHVC